ncbi:MAG: hypothetical protein FWD65_06855 [Coriobacteriia bacterium]|nr:hypothetical protein [Coriobacteriia bacterium]
MPQINQLPLIFWWEYDAARVLGVLICCGLLPAVALHFLMKAFRKRTFLQIENYAGRFVSLGLGFVWPLWGCGVVALTLAASAWYKYWPRLGGSIFLSEHLLGYALAAGAVFAFGLIDDLGGGGASKGFKGHLKALAHGQVTTGVVKLFGIGITAIIFAFYVIEPAPLTGCLMTAFDRFHWVIFIFLVGGAVALSANFVNLCDLRPGRASKVSILLLVIGLVASVILRLVSADSLTLSSLYLEFLWFLVFLLPMLVTLRYDLRERGMLGDAGANSSGFIAGAYIVMRLGLVGLAVYFAVMLALNLISEKVSYSQVIEKNPLLSRLDQIGRIKQGKQTGKKESTD